MDHQDAADALPLTQDLQRQLERVISNQEKQALKIAEQSKEIDDLRRQLLRSEATTEALRQRLDAYGEQIGRLSPVPNNNDENRESSSSASHADVEGSPALVVSDVPRAEGSSWRSSRGARPSPRILQEEGSDIPLLDIPHIAEVEGAGVQFPPPVADGIQQEPDNHVEAGPLRPSPTPESEGPDGHDSASEFENPQVPGLGSSSGAPVAGDQNTGPRYRQPRNYNSRFVNLLGGNQFVFHHKGNSIANIWAHWKNGTHGNPSIESLEDQYGPSWRRDVWQNTDGDGEPVRISGTKFASNYVAVRRKIILWIEERAALDQVSTGELIRRLDAHLDGRVIKFEQAIAKGQDPFVMIPPKAQGN